MRVYGERSGMGWVMRMTIPAMPVEIEGVVDDCFAYFTARWDLWEFSAFDGPCPDEFDFDRELLRSDVTLRIQAETALDAANVYIGIVRRMLKRSTNEDQS